MFWLFSYGFTAFFGMASEYTGVTFRIKYFESVLKQDITWFEDNDPQFLATKINKEANEIQSATSEKAANIIFGLTILFSGIIISFILSWKFTLVCCCIFPALYINMRVLVKTFQKSYMVSLNPK